MLEYWKHLKMA